MTKNNDSKAGAILRTRSSGRMPRRVFLKRSASAVLGLACGVSASKAEDSVPASRPNILWITMEDTCPHFLGCYGNKNAHTPNMDRLASQGVRITRAFSTAPVCAPSRCTIITGCLPEKLGTGHHRSQYPIPDSIKGFPYYLRQAGYYTTNNSKTDYNIADEQRFIHETWDECFGGQGWGTSYSVNDDTFDESSTEAGWWHRKPGQPFFSVYNLFNSHQSRTMTHPYEWYVENVLNKLPDKDRILPAGISVPPFYRDTPEMRKYLCRVYNSLQLTDREFGGILSRLEKDGLNNDTIVFCFADHGEGIPRGKHSAMGLGFQVPFFVYFPPKYQHLSPWPIGQASEELVSSSEDIAPTILSLAGVEIPKHMTGRPLLGAKRRAPRKYVWSSRNRIDESPDLSRAVTDGRFFYTRVFMPQLPQVKYTKYMDVGDIMRTIRADYNAGHLNELQASLVKPEQPTEYLFDLNNDPWQIHNLADLPDYHVQLETLRSALQQHLREIRDIHFLPEYEMAQRAKEEMPCEFRLDNKAYPFERILAAANQVGAGREAIADQLKLLQEDSDATVRYWGAVALDAQGEAVRPYEKEILAALEDPHPSVQMAVAGIACKHFQSAKARDILEQWIRGNNQQATLQALQTVEYLRDYARPFASSLHKFLAPLSEADPDCYDIVCAAQGTLHFLLGAPLYYKDFAHWTPRTQMEPDPTVHFER
jgi:arylsulfatase A-like enzyme